MRFGGLGRRRGRALVGVVAGLATLLGAAGASAAPGQPNQQLLKRYQPVLVFHPEEAFRPAKVQSFVADSRLERLDGGTWTVVDESPEPGELGSLPEGTYRLDQAACSAAAPLAGIECYAAAAAEGAGGQAMYGRVVRTATHTVLQYWLFYHHNPLLLPPTPFVPGGVFWQSHEGDWEVVNVVLDALGQPTHAAYSQHCSGRRMAWEGVEKLPAGSTHPVVYVGLGSHANFFRPGSGALGLVPLDPACVPPALAPFLPPFPFLFDQVLDGSAAGAVTGPPGGGASDSATIHAVEGMPWSTFPGRWGESEYFFSSVPIGPLPGGVPVPVGQAPASPPHQAHWNPEVVLGWPLAP